MRPAPRRSSRPSVHTTTAAPRGARLTPTDLAGSALCRRVPAEVRSQIDSAILLRPPELATLELIAARFQLKEQYGVTPAALRAYARRIEELARPVATARLMAGVYGCLPAAQRRKLLAGSQVLLLSRVIQVLSTEGDTALSVAELARLGSIVSGMAGRKATRNPKPAKDSKNRTRGRAEIPADGGDIAALVRQVYGLNIAGGEQTPGSALPVQPSAASATERR